MIRRYRIPFVLAVLLINPFAGADERVGTSPEKEFTAGAEWPSYNKSVYGHRYSPLDADRSGERERAGGSLPDPGCGRRLVSGGAHRDR